MLEYKGIDILNSSEGIVLTIGSFDGVHIGHRSVIRQLSHIAACEGAHSMIVTLSPHPRTVINNNEKFLLIYPDREKSILLERLGIDYLYNINFNRELSQLTACEFILKHITSKFNLKAILMGYNNFIGSDRASIDKLAELADKGGFKLISLQEESVEGDKISSTIIRELLSNGEIERATQLLGHNYFIVSDIESGRLTARMDERIMLPEGDYSVRVKTKQGYVESTATVDQEQIRLNRDMSEERVEIEFLHQ